MSALAASALPAYAGYSSISVEQDTSSYNLTAGFDANPGDGGVENTAFGLWALSNAGCCTYYNSAFGYWALYNDGLGAYNTGLGYTALYANTSGSQNTGIGAGALFWTTGGSNNTAVGYDAALQNTGSNNTAIGFQTLGGYIDAAKKSSGNNNAVLGYDALYLNETGYANASVGAYSMLVNTTGYQNAAVGLSSLRKNTTGYLNVAIGYEAGSNLTTGSNNIEIANAGGSATESGVIRIGTLGVQTTAFVQGIAGTTLTTSTPAAVYVDPATGQLGLAASSERFKTDIETMGEATRKLDQLRPVTFKLKSDESGPVQYGLIAEEVARVYPELVLHDQNGRISGVRYEELAPMLLNELQRQQKVAADQQERLADQARQLEELQQQVAALLGRAAAP
jgi:hypothetical protein